jgi:hypothetical protein
VCTDDLKTSNCTDKPCRQPHDKRHKAAECCWNDSWTKRWHSEERKNETCCQDWTDALEGSLVSCGDGVEF